MNNDREKFSRFGALMAMAGSAVGLGNLWRFPYLVGENGGGAFILLYIICSIFLAIPIFIAEASVGRRAGSDCFGAFKKLSGGKKWKWVGFMSVITAVIIISYYCVIGGWSLQYFFKALGFGFSQVGSQQEISTMFSRLATGIWAPLLGFVIFFGIAAAIVMGGVKKGIERFGKIVMPSLFFIVIAIAVYVCFLPGAMDGIRYLLIPDFSKVTTHTLADALGQSFFSLSLGCGCIMTYASYMSRHDNIVLHCSSTAGIDLLFAMIAGCAIMPAVFAFGVNPQSGPSLVYETLPFIFSKMPAGDIVAILFFFALLVAALTSAVSMVEVVAAFLIEEKHLPRKKAICLILSFCTVLGVFCTLSFGPLANVKIFQYTIFEACDKLSSNVLMTVGSLLTVIFAGWVLPEKDLRDEITSSEVYENNSRMFGVIRFLIKFVAPITVITIIIIGLL